MNRFIPLIAGCVLMPAVLLLAGCKKATPPIQAPPPPKVTVATPVKLNLFDFNEYTGMTKAIAKQELKAQVSGYLTEIKFKDGDKVKAGDVLFVIDRRPYQASLERAEADVQSSKAKVEQTQKEYQRLSILLSKGQGAVSPSDVEVAKANAQVAVASVKSAEANVATAKLNVEFTEIKAQIDGRIGAANVREGNLISVGASLAVINPVDPIYAYFDIDAAGGLRYRQAIEKKEFKSARDGKLPAKLRLDGERSYRLDGHTDFVDNRYDEKTGAIRLRAKFDNVGEFVLPNEFVYIRVPGERGRISALMVREEAIFTMMGKPFVMIVDAENKAKPVPIVTDGGVNDRGYREVRSGIKETDRIIVVGLMFARPGQPVEPEMVEMMSADTQKAFQQEWSDLLPETPKAPMK